MSDDVGDVNNRCGRPADRPGKCAFLSERRQSVRPSEESTSERASERPVLRSGPERGARS